MQTKTNILAAVLALSVFLTACTEKIKVELGSGQVRLVVDARFTSDTTVHKVKLSRTCDYYDPDIAGTAVTGAQVYITDPDGNRIDFLPDTVPGVYVTTPDVFGIMGQTYELHIIADVDKDGENEIYQASEQMPYITYIDSVRLLYGAAFPPFFAPDPKNLGFNFCLYAKDPPTKEYYGFSFAVNRKIYRDSLSNMFLFPDEFSGGLYLNGVALFFFPDQSEDPDKETRKVILKTGDVVTLYAYSFTSEFNTYISDVRTAIAPNIPIFGGAPSNVKGNVSNNAFGYFAVYAVRKSSCIVPPRPGFQNQ